MNRTILAVLGLSFAIGANGSTRAARGADDVVPEAPKRARVVSRSGARVGTALFAELRHAGRHFTAYTNYRNRSPQFVAPLGFFTRVDMRQIKAVAG